VTATVAAAPAPHAPWITAPVVAMAAFMEVLDISIANVALQHIAGSMAASRDESTWILTSYLVTNAVVLPVSGWLSSVVGRKRFYMACIAGFGASSLLCGSAPNLELLILFRALQGLTGGGLQPSSQAILADAFPPRQRGMAFAFYGIAVVAAPAIGPTLGGWITDNMSWRWVFLINVPISVILFFAIEVMIFDPPQQEAARQARLKAGVRIDYLGFGLLAIGLGCLQLVLDRGQEDDWFGSDLITVASTLAALALVSLVVWELRRDDPIVDLRLLRSRNFAVANLLMFTLGFVLLGSTALLPLFVQALLGYTATDAGLVLSPGGLGIMLLMPLVGRLVTRVDPRWMIAFGLSVTTGSLLWLATFNLQVDFATLAWARVFQASGFAFLFIPITTLAYTSVPPDKNNNASALINLSRNLGGSIGIALLTTLLARTAQQHQNVLIEHVTPYDPAYQAMAQSLQHRMLGQGGSAADALLKAQAMIANLVDQQAQLLAYLDDFRLLALIFAGLVPLVFLMRRPAPGAGPLAGGH
jgi:DHA2 family multidrug resistance protein